MNKLQEVIEGLEFLWFTAQSHGQLVSGNYDQDFEWFYLELFWDCLSIDQIQAEGLDE